MFWEDGHREILILEIDHDKANLGIDLTDNERNGRHFEPVMPNSVLQLTDT